MHCLINDFSGTLRTNSDCLCIKREANLVEASGCFPIGKQETGLKLGAEEEIINQYSSWSDFAQCQWRLFKYSPILWGTTSFLKGSLGLFASYIQKTQLFVTLNLEWTHFRMPLCNNRALEGRDDKNNLKKLTIFPRFLATGRRENTTKTLVESK